MLALTLILEVKEDPKGAVVRQGPAAAARRASPEAKEQK
uniref:Uncharacterized protein n=1 Tax=Nonomuraea gerenzanensis TaxID=93944 RepID=A0A1M4E3D0_9ACTN|nr:hypothetical protein BN4615_P2806 [Nonomuraea gerenzanensis]